MIDLKADQDEIKEVLGNEYQDYNLERYQQTVIHRISINFLHGKRFLTKLVERMKESGRKKNWIRDI